MSLEVVRSVMDTIRTQVAKDVLCAGGYVRDLTLGFEPKDVDIWYHDVAPEFTDELCPLVVQNPKMFGTPTRRLTRPFGLITTLIARLRKKGHKVGNPVFCTAYSEAGGMSFADDLTKLRVDGVEFDLIALKMPTSQLLDQFDFGICKAAFDGKSLFLHPHFTEDLENTELRFRHTTRDEEDMNRVLNDHLPRLRKKFPDWKVTGLEEYGVE